MNIIIYVISIVYIFCVSMYVNHHSSINLEPISLYLASNAPSVNFYEISSPVDWYRMPKRIKFAFCTVQRPRKINKYKVDKNTYFAEQ